MSEDNKQKTPIKKNFPGGFLLFILASILIVLTFQSLTSEKMGKVSFSHEVEHLVNLDLLQEGENRKIALNDNLVTFSGKFKSQVTEEAKTRFKFLELLSQHNELTREKEHLSQDLAALRTTVKDAADLYLHLTGLPLPYGGYKVLDTPFDTANKENAITIGTLSPNQVVSLQDLENRFPKLQEAPVDSSFSQYGKDLHTLIQGFRSPVLGIGNETLKEKLKTLEESVVAANDPTSYLSVKEKLEIYRNSLKELKGVALELNQENEGSRLIALRSVRNYKTDLEQYNNVVEQLEKNTAQLDKAREAVSQYIWFFNNLEVSTRSLEKQDQETFSRWFVEAKQEWENFATNKGTFFKAPDQPRTLALEKTFKSEEPSPNYFSYLLTILPVLMVVFVLYFIFSRQMKGAGSGAMNFGKSPAKLLTKERNKITFKDVAGCDEAKEELQEIVDFLKDPSKFTTLGARIPKGVLLVGAPGTGKTLVAKAVAGEADRPFFSISGSDFVEMFVGVGASRVRDMFEQAKKNAPCIIFMDEIDAVGRHRGAGIGGGHDEREQTLNQLLVEMDGFDTNEGVILIAATNRPDVLDKALLRPGRFDRRVVIDLPDVKGRNEILKVHAKKIKLDPSVNLMDIARNTAGSSGADLANILNESALLAARKGRSAVTGEDAAEACDKVRYGKERKSLELDISEKKTTAYHESGHAIVALFVKHSDPVDKVTIIPRGMSLGATHFLPKKNRLSYWRKELLDQLAVLMGGRVAEEIFVNDISSGAQMDIAQATRLVRSMICEWGMNDEVGLVSYDERSESGQYLGMNNYQEKKYSEATAKTIDIEVRKLLDEAHVYAYEIIKTNKDKVQLMTDLLMEFETLDKEDVLEILHGTWDSDKKRERLKKKTEAFRKLPPPAPIILTPPTDSPEPQGI